MGTRVKFWVVSATCEVGTVSRRDSHTLKDFRPPSECARQLIQQLFLRSPNYLWSAQRLCCCGFHGVLSSSAFFRDSRRFVSNFETAIRLQGFSQAVDAAAGSSFHFIPASPACAAHLTRYGAHRLVPLLTGLRSWGLVRPSERCSSRRTVRNFVRILPACCFAKHLACAFYGAT
jgi:hypothetical protein